MNNSVFKWGLIGLAITSLVQVFVLYFSQQNWNNLFLAIYMFWVLLAVIGYIQKWKKA